MEDKILVVSAKFTNLTEAIMYQLNEVKLNLILVTNDLKKITEKYSNSDHIEIVKELNDSENISSIIYLNYDNYEKYDQLAVKNNLPVIYVDCNISPLKANYTINYIKSNILSDDKVYSEAEKDFLFKKGLYSILLKELYRLLKDGKDAVNGTIIDLDNVKSKFDDWIFDFDSVNESYSWLTKMIRKQDAKNEIKILELYFDGGIQYADSDKEIKYLTERINAIRNGKKITEIFLRDKAGFEKLKQNHFFKTILKEVSDNYQIYFLYKEDLIKYSKEITDDIEYGIIIFEDCYFRDYQNIETCLGYVDCNRQTIEKYSHYFETIRNSLATKIETEDDLNVF